MGLPLLDSGFTVSLLSCPAVPPLSVTRALQDRQAQYTLSSEDPKVPESQKEARPGFLSPRKTCPTYYSPVRPETSCWGRKKGCREAIRSGSTHLRSSCRWSSIKGHSDRVAPMFAKPQSHYPAERGVGKPGDVLND